MKPNQQDAKTRQNSSQTSETGHRAPRFLRGFPFTALFAVILFFVCFVKSDTSCHVTALITEKKRSGCFQWKGTGVTFRLKIKHVPETAPLCVEACHVYLRKTLFMYMIPLPLVSHC